MKLRLEKGTYRYRTAHKKRQLFFVVLFILAIIAQLILRNFITEQIYKKSCHDQCDPHGATDGKPRVPTGGCSEDPGGPGGIFTTRVFHTRRNFPILYDLIITSNGPDHAGGRAGCPSDRGSTSTVRTKTWTGGRRKILKRDAGGLEAGRNAKVMNEEKKFLRRLSELKTVTEEEDDGSAPHVLKLLKSLSM